MTDERHIRGEQVRRDVLGDAHVDAAEAGATDFTRPFQDYLTGAAWADVWDRPGLDRRTRSAITLAMLSALGAESEIPMHIRAGLRNGLTREEIGEVLLQVAVYAGLPAANAAFRLADAVLRDEDAAGG
jgi:4-carboxymuconolactone decarboxylase